MVGKMSTFIDLLRQHHQALETQYSVKLSHDMRRAIYPCLCVKRRSSDNHFGPVNIANTMTAHRFPVVIETAYSANKTRRHNGWLDKRKSACLLNISW